MSSRIKGASLIANIAMVRELLGAARFATVVAACPPETQQLLRRTLVAVEWLPVDQWCPFLEVLYERVFRGDEEQFRRLLRGVCKREFNTIYRAFLNGITPDVLMGKTSVIWSTYFDSGSLRAGTLETVEGPPRYLLMMRDLETNYLLYAIAIQAYIEQLLHMAGAPDFIVQRSKEGIRVGRLGCDYIIQCLG